MLCDRTVTLAFDAVPEGGPLSANAPGRSVRKTIFSKPLKEKNG
jgi:hypothetical protein